MDAFSVAKSMKILCAHKETNVTQLGLQLGLSKENIHAQFKRDNFKLSDIIKIADALDYDVILQFKDRETGKIIDVERKTTKAVQADSVMSAPPTPEQPKEKTGINKLIETLEDMQRQ